MCGHEDSLDSPVPYAMSVTNADLVMTDGKSLEGVGVEPDIVVLPISRDLSKQARSRTGQGCRLGGSARSLEEAGPLLSSVLSNQFQTSLSLND